MLQDEYLVISLRAISLGYAVPQGDFSTTVHSVFPEAVNLRIGTSSQLLTLLTVDCADLPQGIRLGTSPGFSFENILFPGEKIACRNGRLEDEHERLAIDLRQAKRWRCKIPELGVDGITQPIVSTWNLAWKALNERQRRFGTEIVAMELSRIDSPEQTSLTRTMSALVRALVEAARNLDASGEACIAGLIGLGSGLTPSGDDFLVGFLTGLHCTSGKNKARLEYLAEVGKMVENLSEQTNDISRTYLFHATRGQVSSRLVELVEAMAGGKDSEHLLQAAENAMQVGHSSGMETVTGLLIGMSTWGDGLAAV